MSEHKANLYSRWAVRDQIWIQKVVCFCWKWLCNSRSQVFFCIRLEGVATPLNRQLPPSLKLAVFIPRETRGYRFQLSVCPSVRLSVCPSVRLSGFVSRPYLRKCSMDFFKISHTDRTSMEGVQRRSFVRFDEKMWKWQDFEN